MAFENITLDRVWTSEELMHVLGFTLPTRVSSFNMRKCTENGIKVLYTGEVALKNLTWNKANSLDLIDKGRLVTIEGDYYNCKIISGVTDGVTGGELKELRINGNISISIDTLLRDIASDSNQCYIWQTSFANIGKAGKDGLLGALFIFKQITDISISIDNSDLGDHIITPQISYKVTGTNLNNITIRESLNNQLINNRTNLTNNSTFIINLASHFEELSYGKHEVTLELVHNNTTVLKTISIIFNKIKTPVPTLPTTVSLKQAIAHNKKIEKEIEYQCLILANTLDDKGIELFEVDKKKLSTLIGKVGDIVNVIGVEKLPKWYNYEPKIEDMWIAAKDTILPIYEAKSCTVNGKIYVMIGREPSNSTNGKNNQCYDPVLNVWSRKADAPTSSLLASVASLNDKIYAIGGGVSPYTKNQCYDTTTDSWSDKATMPTGRYNLTCSSVDGNIYAIGGNNGSNTYSKNECYDVASNTWSTKTDMNRPRKFLTSSVVDGLIYVIGGLYSNGEFANDNLCYDPISNTWSTKSVIPNHKLGSSTSSVIDKKIYIMGDYSESSPLYQTSQCYDTVSDLWSTISNPPTGRISFASSSIGKNIYVIGGRDARSNHFSVNECYIP